MTIERHMLGPDTFLRLDDFDGEYYPVKVSWKQVIRNVDGRYYPTDYDGDPIEMETGDTIVEMLVVS